MNVLNHTFARRRLAALGLIAAAALLLVPMIAQAIADDAPPASQPALVDVSDKAAVTAAMDKDVEIEGIVQSADWNATGSVMRVQFKNTDESKVIAVAFGKKKEALDKSFSGDIAKALMGAHVRIKGTLKDYKGRPEVVIDMPSQITIVEPGPTTQPS